MLPLIISCKFILTAHIIIVPYIYMTLQLKHHLHINYLNKCSQLLRLIVILAFTDVKILGQKIGKCNAVLSWGT